jgi:uridine kinase
MESICSISNDGVRYEDYIIKGDERLCDVVRKKGISDAICALMDGSVVSLGDPCRPGATVRFLSPYKNEQASRVFLRGATFLLYCAAKALYPERQLLVDHALCGGVFCELGKVTPEVVKTLNGKINEYIEADKEFTLEVLPVEEARQALLAEGLTDKVRLLE